MKRKSVSKAVVAFALCVAMLSGAALAFNDVDSSYWGDAAIERVSGFGIIKGDANGNFNPNGEMTRAELAQVIYAAMGYKAAPNQTFSDVNSSDWYAEAVSACAAAGVISGTGNGKMNPNAVATREQTMVILARALGIKPAASGTASFADGASVSSWAEGYVAAMTKAGYVSGTGDNKLMPAAEITRASVVSILNKCIAEYITAPGTYDLTGKEGIVIVKAAGEVILTGKTEAGVLVAAGATGSVVIAKGAVIGGDVVANGTASVTNNGTISGELVNSGTGAVTNNGTVAGGTEGTVVDNSKPSTGGSGPIVNPPDVPDPDVPDDPTEEDNTEEDNTEEDNTEEDNTEEDNTEEDNTEENNTEEDNTEENNTEEQN